MAVRVPIDSTTNASSILLNRPLRRPQNYCQSGRVPRLLRHQRFVVVCLQRRPCYGPNQTYLSYFARIRLASL